LTGLPIFIVPPEMRGLLTDLTAHLTAIKRSKGVAERVIEENWTRSEKLNLAQ
tara:strand:+ start:285 stop:443 length:159 start_codon:yes stop_codon:yes gene_type:complete